MSVRYHDETQEIIEWYKNECPVDGEELNDDIDNDEHVPVRHSEDSTAIDSISGFNHGERGLDQNLSDDGYSTPEYQQYCLSGMSKAQKSVLLASHDAEVPLL